MTARFDRSNRDEHVATAVQLAHVPSIRQATSLPAVADAALAGLERLRGVIAVALIGFDRGQPAMWIGDDKIAAGAIRAFLAGGDDPQETLALATGGVIRASPIAGGRGIAGVIQLVATGEQPSWGELALIGAQISARLAVLGIERPLHDHCTTPSLPERQREIAWLIARGCTNAEIARMLDCSASTVKAQVSQLLARFDVTNRTELAALASPRSEATPTTRTIYLRGPS